MSATNAMAGLICEVQEAQGISWDAAWSAVGAALRDPEVRAVVIEKVVEVVEVMAVEGEVEAGGDRAKAQSREKEGQEQGHAKAQSRKEQEGANDGEG